MSWAVERALRVGAVGVCAALAACGGDGGSPTGSEGPASLEVAMGAGQSGVVGTALLTPIGIKVTGASGKTLAGVTVNFTVRANSGSLSASSWKTNASGIASVNWTLGEKAGANADTLEASVSGLSQTVIVTASATAGAPASLVVISGDAQVGSPGEQAAEPLVVEVRDAHANARQGTVVSWTVEGGGTLSAAKDTTDSDGRASVIWTLGAGDNRVTAAIAELTNVTAPFAASLTASDVVQLDDVSPDTLVEGGSATLTGTGFSASMAENKVYVDGVPAVVNSATATTLGITVPAFDCKPTRDAPVRVVVGTEGSNAVTRSVEGKGTAVKLALGEQLIVRDPAKFCLQLAESAVPASYLVGAQSVSELVGSLTPVTVSATAAPSGALLALPRSASPLTSRLATSGAALASVLATPDDQRWRLHRAAEARLRERERQLMAGRVIARSQPRRAAGRISALQVSGSVQVGDTIPIKFPDISTNFCSTSIPIKTVVRAVGTKGIWLEDVANPTGGYTTTDFQNLSNEFDNDIYASDVAYFGEPTDFDNNGHVVIVTTKEVNKSKNVLGFVVSTDLAGTSICAASNDGEFYYGRAPDPDGTYEEPAPYDLTSARRDAQLLIAHEFTHVIQFGRRLTYPGAEVFQSVWEMEGQATLAQEVVGHDINGRTSGQNYGAAVALSSDASGVAWYSPGFTDLALYFGFRSKTVQVATAPEQCSWLDLASNGNNGPCISGREVYGVPWLFLRWLSDQFGGSVAGGEAGVQKALIDNTRAGYENVENVTGVNIDTLLAQWAATLYTDDLWYPLNPNPRLTYTSWNLQDVYSRFEATARLTPNAHSFQSFAEVVSVRGGSTAYFTLSGSSAPATAVKLRDASGKAIAAGGPMQLWIVRLQ